MTTSSSSTSKTNKMTSGNSTTGWYTNAAKGKKNYEKALGETIPLPTHFKRNGYKTMAAGKIFHKGTSDVKGYDYWDETRPKYKWPKALATRGHGYQGESGGHFHPFPRDGGAIYQKYQKGISGQSLCWGALKKSDMPPEGMPDEQVAAWAVDRGLWPESIKPASAWQRHERRLSLRLRPWPLRQRGRAGRPDRTAVQRALSRWLHVPRCHLGANIMWSRDLLPSRITTGVSALPPNM